MFKECSRENNNRIPLGFVKPSECRIAGKIVAALRVLCLKRALQQCIKKPQFLCLKMHKQVVVVLQKECVGDFLFAVCHAFYPIMRLVCLADSKLPCMHLLKYFLHQEDCMMREHLQKVELAYYAIPPHIRTIMGDPSNYDIMHTDTTPSKKVPQKSVGS